MPTSAKLLPCSSLSSSGLNMTATTSPVVTLIRCALASWLPGGRPAPGSPRVVMSGPALEIGPQHLLDLIEQAAAQRIQIHRRAGLGEFTVGARGGRHRVAGAAGRDAAVPRA